jgi:hypothetical protein
MAIFFCVRVHVELFRDERCDKLPKSINIFKKKIQDIFFSSSKKILCFRKIRRELLKKK